jgi:signal transduction histidine kinase
MTVGARQHEELRQLVEEQTALRRVATLVARGAGDDELLAAVTYEIARLFGAHAATTLRWDGSTIRVIGDWSASASGPELLGRTFAFGGDTITARAVTSGAPERIESAEDYATEFARARWEELGFQAAIAAPIVVDGRVWGVITASRTTLDDPFPPGAEEHLGDFAALVAQAIANAEARREVAALIEEQSALRRVATLVAGGRPQTEVLDAVAREACRVFGAQSVYLVRWQGVHDEVVVVGGGTNGSEPPVAPGSLYHPAPESATIRVLETGLASRTDEDSAELGGRSGIAAPVIVDGRLVGALTALRAGGEPFPAHAEERLRSFADLVAQSIANSQARESMRASRARLVRAADEARERLERNLHDGAQQRLVAVSLSLRMAMAKLDEPEKARALLESTAAELNHAIDELREFARGIHPAVLTEHGLGPALEVLATRAPLPVEIANELEQRLPPAVEAAAYFVVAESLTNVAKHAQASFVEVRVSRHNGMARVEVVDDGVGGADASCGSGLRGLADRVEAVDGRLHVVSPPAEGTRVWADLPLS